MIFAKREVQKKLYLAIAEGDIIKYDRILEMPIEDFLIKVDQYTRELTHAIEYEMKLEQTRK